MSDRRSTVQARERSLWLGLLVVLGLLAAVPVLALDAQSPTGLRATIHSAAEISDRWLVVEDGRTLLRHPVAGELELEMPAAEATAMVPMDPTDVADAIAAVHGFRADIQVEVFLLPAMPADIGSSFARRDVLFMAPGVHRQARSTVAYLVTHELGHALCWASLDGRPERWSAYRDLRGLSVQDSPAYLPHAERNREIIAEDLRYLFGGDQATASGTIENPSIPLPDAVQGLSEMLAGFLADRSDRSLSMTVSRVYPNPCVGEARVEIMLPAGADKGAVGTPVLEIYDVRGRLVRRLVSGRVANGRATVVWDGNREGGGRAAAGVYCYRIVAAKQSATGSLQLCR